MGNWKDMWRGSLGRAGWARERLLKRSYWTRSPTLPLKDLQVSTPDRCSPFRCSILQRNLTILWLPLFHPSKRIKKCDTIHSFLALFGWKLPPTKNIPKLTVGQTRWISQSQMCCKWWAVLDVHSLIAKPELWSWCMRFLDLWCLRDRFGGKWWSILRYHWEAW